MGLVLKGFAAGAIVALLLAIEIASGCATGWIRHVAKLVAGVVLSILRDLHTLLPLFPGRKGDSGSGIGKGAPAR